MTVVITGVVIAFCPASTTRIMPSSEAKIHARLVCGCFDPLVQCVQLGPSPIFGIPQVAWLGNPYWARFCVILVNVWVGSPFFMIMYLAALKSVPEQLHEAAAIDGANWLQKIWYINLPMMRNIIQITALFSLIVTFANFDIVKILTNGGPVDQTHVFATWAVHLGDLGQTTFRSAHRYRCSWPRSWQSRHSSSCAMCAAAETRHDNDDGNGRATAGQVGWARYGSISRGRRRALFWSYFSS